MSKNNGFTLAELLATIVILVLISLVAIPSVLKTIKDSKSELYDNQINLIKSTAISYVADQIMHPDINSSIYQMLYGGIDEYNIYLIELQQLGYADFEITNPLCDEKGYFDSSKIYVNIKKQKNNEYLYTVMCQNNCDIKSSCLINV